MPRPISLVALLAVLTLLLPAAGEAFAENIVYPADSGIANIKDYGAVGDGVADDTAAMKKAFAELRGTNRTLYFPNGTYLISDRINISGDDRSKAHSKDRFLNLQGQSQAGAILKLKDNSPGFGDPTKPRTFISLYEGEGTGDCMHGYIRNLTVDVGSGNAGVAALRFMANNTGGIYDVTIRSSDPKRAGHIGLDLRQGQQGPHLIKRVTVVGFDHGVQSGDTFSMVFEDLTLQDQNVVGYLSQHSRLTIRGLKSRNKVPAIRGSVHTNLTLIDSELLGGASDVAALELATNKVFLRDVRHEGYGHLVKKADGTHLTESAVAEWFDGQGQSLFGAKPTSLRLPIEETPTVPWETDLKKWVAVEYVQGDNTAATQAAFDRAAAEGATTVYFPKGSKWLISGPIRIHGSVNRVLGMENIIDVPDSKGVFKDGSAVFTFENLTSPVFIFERFFLLGGWDCPAHVHMFENRSGKVIVLANMPVKGTAKKVTPGSKWFFEDVVTSRVSTLKVGKGEQIWARHFNSESPLNPMIEVDGGMMWILGFKTEGRSTHLIARNGAKAEIIGGVVYQSWKNQKLDPPMLQITDSQVSATLGFYHHDTPFATIAEETLKGETRTLPRDSLKHYHLPVYRSGGPATQP